MSIEGAKALSDVVLHSPVYWGKFGDNEDIIQVHVPPCLLHRLLLPNPKRIFLSKETSYLGFLDPAVW